MSRKTRLRVLDFASDLAISVYRASSGFPPSERFGVTSQIRRSAVSVGSNLAEGSMRQSDKEFARFASIALGSLSELEFQLSICRRLGYVSGSVAEAIMGEITSLRRQISRLRGTLVTESARSVGEH